MKHEKTIVSRATLTEAIQRSVIKEPQKLYLLFEFL